MTNVSTSLSLTVADEGSRGLIVHSIGIELIIPRDINLVLPPMTLQNVTSTIIADRINNRQFNLHFISITQPNPNMSVSVHFQLRPLDPRLGYLVIYRFDDIPRLNSSINQTDGWSLLLSIERRTVHHLHRQPADIQASIDDLRRPRAEPHRAG